MQCILVHAGTARTAVWAGRLTLFQYSTNSLIYCFDWLQLPSILIVHPYEKWWIFLLRPTSLTIPLLPLKMCITKRIKIGETSLLCSCTRCVCHMCCKTSCNAHSVSPQPQNITHPWVRDMYVMFYPCNSSTFLLNNQSVEDKYSKMCGQASFVLQRSLVTVEVWVGCLCLWGWWLLSVSKVHLGVFMSSLMAAG